MSYEKKSCVCPGGANLEGVQLEEYEENYFDHKADCWDVVFTKTNLSGANLRAAKVNSPNWIDLLKKLDVRGYEAIADQYIVDKNLCLRLKSDTTSPQFHA